MSAAAGKSVTEGKSCIPKSNYGPEFGFELAVELSCLREGLPGTEPKSTTKGRESSIFGFRYRQIPPKVSRLNGGCCRTLSDAPADLANAFM